MSDYEDDYDYDFDEGDFLYVEDEYMPADDLAEHAVASPPPTTCGDDDMFPDWDRFDYYNDIEYDSNGYDDTKFQAHNVKDAKTGDKRKRLFKTAQGKRRLPNNAANDQPSLVALEHSPIVWRSQKDRGLKPKSLEGNAQSYALFKNWREKLPDTPDWARGSPPTSPSTRSSKPTKALGNEPASPPYDEPVEDDDEDMDEDEDEDEGPSDDALLAALRQNLAASGGPLANMDPQQLLEYVKRMAAGEGDGDDVAGEMAEALLRGGGDDDDEEGTGAEDEIQSWVAQQRPTGNTTTQESPNPENQSERPPTPPSSEANRSVRVTETTTKPIEPDTKKSLKRKADKDVDSEAPTKVAKKRATRSFDAPTASSQARAAPVKAKTERTLRGRKP